MDNSYIHPRIQNLLQISFLYKGGKLIVVLIKSPGDIINISENIKRLFCSNGSANNHCLVKLRKGTMSALSSTQIKLEYKPII